MTLIATTSLVHILPAGVVYRVEMLVYYGATTTMYCTATIANPLQDTLPGNEHSEKLTHRQKIARICTLFSLWVGVGWYKYHLENAIDQDENRQIALRRLSDRADIQGADGCEESQNRPATAASDSGYFLSLMPRIKREEEIRIIINGSRIAWSLPYCVMPHVHCHIPWLVYRGMDWFRACEFVELEREYGTSSFRRSYIFEASWEDGRDKPSSRVCLARHAQVPRPWLVMLAVAVFIVDIPR
ncbi:hypothetical protein PM082_018644 [Marasmius tenuissimus]|nr:hypothetical protein PM082_018644 [Marasmius tenuissimus]